MEVYPYLDHSGSLAPGTSGYETTLQVPASVMFNLFYDFSQDLTSATPYGNGKCYWQPDQAPYDSDYSPHSNRNNGNQPQIDIWDSVHGWIGFTRIIDLCGAYRPTSSKAFYGLTVTSSASPNGSYFHINNPTRWRISYPSPAPWLDPTVSWVHVNLGLSDQCFLAPPTNPQAAGGYFEGTIPLKAGAVTPFVSAGTLPNGAPLAGRNRVQLIS